MISAVIGPFKNDWGKTAEGKVAILFIAVRLLGCSRTFALLLERARGSKQFEHARTNHAA
jgi:hypothetical protein